MLDQITRDRMYGIHFTEDQLLIIRQLLEILNERNEDEDEHRFNREEDDDEQDDEEEDEDFHQYDPNEDDE